MPELQAAQGLVTALLMMATAAVWPPIGSGAFWILIGVYGVVSVLFDDETPRGIPGIEYLNATRREASETELSKSGN
jgi:hypothetical protein